MVNETEVSKDPRNYGLVAYVAAGCILDEVTANDQEMRARIEDRVLSTLVNDGPLDKEAVLSVARKLFGLV